MPNPAPDPILTAAELERLRAAIAAGEYDHLKAPAPDRLDPAGDPFGDHFAWLDEPDPATPADGAYRTLGVRSESRWYRAVGPDLRRIALEDRFASGTDEEVVRAAGRSQHSRASANWPGPRRWRSSGGSGRPATRPGRRRWPSTPCSTPTRSSPA